MKPEITLIITNWNGSDLLKECLPTVLKAVEYDQSHLYEVMVIDDCSTDDSLEIIAKNFPKIRVEKTPQNLGFQEANNYAVKLTDSKIVMPMNNDIKLDSKALYYLSKHFDNKEIFAVSGKIFAFDQSTFLYGNRGGYFRKGHFYLYEKPPEDDSQTLFACGGAFMVNRKQYLELGGFDSMYHPL